MGNVCCKSSSDIDTHYEHAHSQRIQETVHDTKNQQAPRKRIRETIKKIDGQALSKEFRKKLNDTNCQQAPNQGIQQTINAALPDQYNGFPLQRAAPGYHVVGIEAVIRSDSSIIGVNIKCPTISSQCQSLATQSEEMDGTASRYTFNSIVTPANIQVSTDEKEETKLGLIVIGLVGSGKSSFGNMILDLKVFRTRESELTSDTSFTRTIKCAKQNKDRRTVVVIDTPGIPVDNKNTNKDDVFKVFQSAEEKVKEMPHVFLLVISLHRTLSKEFLPFLQKHYGDVMDCLIVILNCDEIDSAIFLKETSIQTFIKDNSLPLVLINCKCSIPLDSSIKEKVKQILELCGERATSQRKINPKINQILHLSVI